MAQQSFPPLTLKSSKEKLRLDLLLVQKGLLETRHQSQALILSGKILVEGIPQTKAGTLVPLDAKIEVVEPPLYVGRGGIKLEKALKIFKISASGKTCLDVGASTGGFTDCLLKQGAGKVYAVDVGKGQLAWKLRGDPRVVCLEKVNARYLSRKEIPEPVDLFTVDVSFISAKKILPALKSVAAPEGEFIVLVKPQFEAGPKQVRKGIVKEKKIHEEVLNDMVSWLKDNSFFVRGLTYSPITGGDGNIEFFLHLDLQGPWEPCSIAAVVEEAHQILKGSP